MRMNNNYDDTLDRVCHTHAAAFVLMDFNYEHYLIESD